MHNNYQARWLSKTRFEELRRTNGHGGGVLLESFNGFLVVEPVGSDLGDGAVLTPEETEYEVQPAWCLGTNVRLAEARTLLVTFDNTVATRRALAKRLSIAGAIARK